MIRHALSLGGLLVAIPALAQESRPDDIVVTGHGLESLRSTVTATSTVTIDVSEGNASGRMEDLLRTDAALAQFRRADARSAHPTAQGITMRGIGGTAASRVLLLIDGVPQADPFGGWMPFPAWMPDRFSRITLSPGGGSAYAGPGALAGVIEMDSGDPRSLDRLRLGLDYGSRNGVDARALGSARLGEGFASFAGQYMRGDGFVPIAGEDRGPVDRPAPYEQASLALRGVVPIAAVTELQANMSGFRDRRDRGIDHTGIKSDGMDASLRLVGRGDWQWSALAWLQLRAFASGFASVDDARTTVAPTLDQYNVPSTGIGGRVEIEPPLGDAITLRLGADARRVSGETQELYTFVGGQPTRRREAGGSSLTLGGSADLRIDAGALRLQASGRIDHWRIADGRLVERPLAGGAALTDLAFPDRSGWEGTGQLGISGNVAGPLKLRLLGYRAWRLPTLNELYRPFRVGADAIAANPALAPERLWGAEAGADLAVGRGITFHATGYWNRLGGAIANVTLAQGPGTFPGVGFVSAAGFYRQRRNLDAIEVTGLELRAEIDRGEFHAYLGYLLADAHVHASGVAAPLDGLVPAQVARHSLSAGLGWHRDDAALSLAARYIAPQFEDDQNSRELADALTFDAVASWPVGGNFVVRGRAENIFDARVETAISGPGTIERASPRTLWLGVAYRLR